MVRLRSLVRAGIFSLMVLSWGAAVLAQYGVRPGVRRTEGPRVDVAGSIEGLAPGGGLLVMGTNRLAWRLQVAPDSNIRVNGKAAQEFLRAGQYVSFRAMVDRRRGTVEENVAHMTIFTPAQQSELGLAPVPGEGPAADASQPMVSLNIRGQVTGLKNGHLVVKVPNRFFKPLMEVPVAENLDLSIDLVGASFISLASKGDGIQASGQLVGPQAMHVQSATVTLANVLGAAAERRGEGDHAKPTRQSKPPRAAVKDKGETLEKAGSEKPEPASPRKKATEPADPAESDRASPADADGPAAEQEHSDAP
jgi:hypothetical protein